VAKVTSVNALVAQIMTKYDHNSNGVVDLKRPDGIWNKLKNPDERVRSKTNVGPSMEEDKLNISTSVYTMRDLFFHADANNDGKVDRDELTNAVKAYDKDGDGQMGARGFWGWLTRKPKQELDLFNQDFGEKLTNYGSVDI
jgi:Ca2+-binding EF-hand superfamily protein